MDVPLGPIVDQFTQGGGPFAALCVIEAFVIVYLFRLVQKKQDQLIEQDDKAIENERSRTRETIAVLTSATDIIEQMRIALARNSQ